MKWYVMGVSGLMVAVNWIIDPWLGIIMWTGLTFAYVAGRGPAQKGKPE